MSGLQEGCKEILYQAADCIIILALRRRPRLMARPNLACLLIPTPLPFVSFYRNTAVFRSATASRSLLHSPALSLSPPCYMPFLLSWVVTMNVCPMRAPGGAAHMVVQCQAHCRIQEGHKLRKPASATAALLRRHHPPPTRNCCSLSSDDASSSCVSCLQQLSSCMPVHFARFDVATDTKQLTDAAASAFRETFDPSSVWWWQPWWRDPSPVRKKSFWSPSDIPTSLRLWANRHPSRPRGTSQGVWLQASAETSSHRYTRPRVAI
jgi:hypothetical protein